MARALRNMGELSPQNLTFVNRTTPVQIEVSVMASDHRNDKREKTSML